MSLHNEVLLQIAAQVMYQQFDFQLQRFHEHLLYVQDLFHEGLGEREKEYALAVRLAVPMIPYSKSEMETAQQRFTEICEKFSAQGDAILQQAREDSELLQDELATLLRKIADDAKAAERARADELFTVTNVCRREVAATVALIKSETAATATEVASMHALQQALDVATAELAQTRATLATATKELDETRANSRVTIDRERMKAHDTIAAERDQLADKIQQVLRDAERDRQRHLDEVTDLHKRHATAVERLRQQCEDLRSELDHVREECEDLRNRESALQRHHASEKANLQKAITELEVQLQAVRVASVQSEGEARARQLELERLSETRKLLEVNNFKRKLAEGSVYGALPAASSPIAAAAAYASSASAGATSPRTLSVMASPRASSREPATARSPSSATATPLQLAATHFSPYNRGNSSVGSLPTYTSATSPPYRESSVAAAASIGGGGAKSPARSVSLRSPSETYVKLQNLSASWRDKLASGSTF